MAPHPGLTSVLRLCTLTFSMSCLPLGRYRTLPRLNPARIACAQFSLSTDLRSGSFIGNQHQDLQSELAVYLQLRTSVRQKKCSQIITNPRSARHQSTMAFLLPGLRRGLVLSTPFILSAPLLAQTMRRPILCDGPDPLSKITSGFQNRYAGEAQTPVIKTSGAPNPRAIRQVSMGSILGVLAGLGVSVFSKPLAILIGLGVVCVQVRMKRRFSFRFSSCYAEGKGIYRNNAGSGPYATSLPSMQVYVCIVIERS